LPDLSGKHKESGDDTPNDDGVKDEWNTSNLPSLQNKTYT